MTDTPKNYDAEIAHELASHCTEEFAESFIRAYARKHFSAVLDEGGYSRARYDSRIEFNLSAEASYWRVVLAKGYHDETVPQSETLQGGLEEAHRRHGWHGSQKKFLVDQTGGR